MDGIQENGVTEKCMARVKKFDRMEVCDTMENGREDNPFGPLVIVEDGVNRAKKKKRGANYRILYIIETPTIAHIFSRLIV